MRERKTKSFPQFATDSEAALESYKTLGYHVEEDIWSPIECEALVRAAKNLSSFKQRIDAPLMQPHPSRARDEAVQLAARVKADPERANIEVGHFVDRRRDLCDYKDIP